MTTKMRRKYRSAPLHSLHKTASDLWAVKAIDDATMAEFDASCLKSVTAADKGPAAGGHGSDQSTERRFTAVESGIKDNGNV
jgi:hypothetical protein